MQNRKESNNEDKISPERGRSIEGVGSFSRLMHVDAVGIKLVVTSENSKVVFFSKPSSGSSSVPVTKMRIFSNVTFSRRPPMTNQSIPHILFLYLIISHI